VRDYILSHGLSPNLVKGLELNTFGQPDTRHVEDCMMYYGIANRIAGTGDDLTRVSRVFDWMVRQVQLVPAGSLGSGQIGQAQARPYDVLLRGLATEADGGWSERGWLFMSLCRQLGIDVGILTYAPPGTEKTLAEGTGKAAKAPDTPQPSSWICAALLDGKLYLFDPRLGMAVPGPGGKGVATLDDALEDPEVLGRLDLPGQATYRPSHALLKRSEIGILIDSSPGYMAPRMLRLQESLSGKNRTILYRDPLDQRDKFARALGKQGGGVKLWPLPLMVQTLIFTDPDFVKATLDSLFLFKPEFPLLYARVKQLRGELSEATEDYMSFRLRDDLLDVNKKNRIPAEIRQALDMYATYFLALNHLEQGNRDLAARFFDLTLRLLPAPGPRQPYYHMFRWGAQANLALLCEEQGDLPRAIALYSEGDPTMQHQGSLIRARDLVWRDPTATPPLPLPPPPTAPAP
jgi:hypothetical protein